MRFSSELERLKHPKVGKIPQSLWEVFFNEEIDTSVLLWVERPELTQSNDFPYEWNSYQNRCIWLVLACNHHKSDPDTLIKLADQLIEKKYLFMHSFYFPDLFKHLRETSSVDEIKKMIREDNYVMFQWAVLSGNLDAIEYLYNLGEPEDREKMIQRKNYGAFYAAAHYGICLSSIIYLRSPQIKLKK